MIPALSSLLAKDESLKAPIYGTLLQKRDYTFGYLALTERALLLSLLHGDTTMLKGSRRITFSSISDVKIKRSLIPFQYILRIYTIEEEMIKLRLSRLVYGFPTQKENLDIFLSAISHYSQDSGARWQP